MQGALRNRERAVARTVAGVQAAQRALEAAQAEMHEACDRKDEIDQILAETIADLHARTAAAAGFTPPTKVTDDSGGGDKINGIPADLYMYGQNLENANILIQQQMAILSQEKARLSAIAEAYQSVASAEVRAAAEVAFNQQAVIAHQQAVAAAANAGEGAGVAAPPTPPVMDIATSLAESTATFDKAASSIHTASSTGKGGRKFQGVNKAPICKKPKEQTKKECEEAKQVENEIKRLGIDKKLKEKDKEKDNKDDEDEDDSEMGQSLPPL